MRKIKVSKSRVAAAALLLVVLVVGILFPVSGSSAKYTTQVSLSGSVSYMVDTSLADKLLAYDPAAAGQTSAETLNLIPGTSVAPTTVVKVEGRKAIPAYLFIEVTGDLPAGLALSADWKELTDVAGPAGGKVYCYQNAPLTIDITAPVFGTLELAKEPLTTDYSVSVTAHLIEIGNSDSTPSAVFADTDPELKKVSSAAVTETFKAVEVSAVVNGDYTVTNTGNIDALIRATVVLNYVDEADNIVASDSPLLKEGVTALSTPAGWTKVGDYLYYNGTVVPNGTTTKPVFSEANAAEAAEGVTVTVTVEAIQAAGGAAAEKWTEATYDPATSNWTATP